MNNTYETEIYDHSDKDKCQDSTKLYYADICQLKVT